MYKSREQSYQYQNPHDDKGLWETEAVSVTGKLWGDITIKCSHSNAISNVKYFCKGACTNEDVLINSREKTKYPKGKYSIIDKGNTFSVTISRLTVDDAGSYWCGIDRVGLDTYNKVVLTVIEAEKKGPCSSVSALSQPVRMLPPRALDLKFVPAVPLLVAPTGGAGSQWDRVLEFSHSLSRNHTRSFLHDVCR
ncbi:hypothetical protein F2P81_004729 [Scophthalmus maximus]|uniref:Immunoglobulin V-set domain-containing protein n=1 Tax=Scophthalmus maximus TaxID=52904 RepID=A0A6A4TN30_SCOMX|nr:hypothetical protein F2P81_004729 [Scophthalmus maximus]